MVCFLCVDVFFMLYHIVLHNTYQMYVLAFVNDIIKCTMGEKNVLWENFRKFGNHSFIPITVCKNNLVKTFRKQFYDFFLAQS